MALPRANIQVSGKVSTAWRESAKACLPWLVK